MSADVRYVKAGGSYLVYSEMGTFPWRPSLIGSVRRDPESGEWYAWAHMPGEPKSWRNHRGTARTRREATDLILAAS